MSFTAPLAYTGANAYAYTGANAYAYTGANAYAYAYGAPMEAYGFDGLPGNPMLAVALGEAHRALRRDVYTDPVASDRWLPGRPLQPRDDVARIGRLGAQVRQSMAQLELLGALQFEPPGDGAPEGTPAVLWADGGAGGERHFAQLVRMTRPPLDYFRNQLPVVDAQGGIRDARLAEILTQVAPPIAQFASVLNLQAGRHRQTLELLNLALQCTYAVTMRFKLALSCPRPSELSAALMPCIEVPAHAALPAGHAAEAHVTATLLGALAGADDPLRSGLRRVAHRIAENRVVAGLHYPIDNVSGRLLGDAFASYLLAACGQAADWHGGEFDGAGLDPAAAGANVFEAEHAADDGRAHGVGCSALSGFAAPAAARFKVLRAMWAAAQAEWAP